MALRGDEHSLLLAGADRIGFVAPVLAALSVICE